MAISQIERWRADAAAQVAPGKAWSRRGAVAGATQGL